MSKIVAVIYSFLILTQSVNINIEDFSKFSVLFEHAQFHQKMYGDSFFEFLSEHYGDNKVSHNSDDHKEHEDLPFKNHHHMLCHINTAFLLTPYISHDLNNPLFKETSLNFFYKESISLFEKSSVFQPPKLA